MSGRGRGRGSGISLTQEQLQVLGGVRGETSAPVLAPPPLFPKLERKPLPLPCDAATDYMLIVKDQFIEYLHESPVYVTARVCNDDIERYSDKYKILALDSKKSGTLECVWPNIPAELRPLVNQKRLKTRKRKYDDPTEIDKRLQILEKKESQNQSADKTHVIDEEGQVKKENESDDEEVEEEQEYEADDGTDYANNYFDNGEDYDDEDDNLDDDPVY